MLKTHLASVLRYVKRPAIFWPILFGLLAFSWQQYIGYARLESLDIPAGNLMPNSSFEELDDEGLPLYWTAVKTGELEYDVESGSGFIEKSDLKIKIASYQSGSLAIKGPKVNVSPNQSYFFKSFYLSDTSFDLLIKYYYADGREKLEWHRHLDDFDYPWSSMSTHIAVPDNVIAVAPVLHLSTLGELDIDGAYLIPSAPIGAEPVGANLLRNGKLEHFHETDGYPQYWDEFQNGDNDATAAIKQELNNSFLVIECNNFKNGEARWVSEAITVSPFQVYNFSFDYRAAYSASVMVEYSLKEGGKKYDEVATLQPSPEWSRYRGKFEIPPQALDVRLSVVQTSIGILETDNYEISIQKTDSKTFSRPLVSITFDDNWLSSFQNGVTELDRRDLKSTMYTNPGSLGDKSFMNEDQLNEMFSKEHHIASHGETHLDFTIASQRKALAELEGAKKYITKNFKYTEIDFASPYGKHDVQVDAKISSLYRSHRGTETGINTRQNFNKGDLKVLFVRKDTSLQQLSQLLDEARTYNGWLIIVYHQIESSDAKFGVSPDIFKKQLDVIQQSGIEIVTVDQALRQTLTQF